MGDGPHQENVCYQGNPLKKDVPRNIFFTFFDYANQSFIDHREYKCPGSIKFLCK